MVLSGGGARGRNAKSVSRQASSLSQPKNLTDAAPLSRVEPVSNLSCEIPLPGTTLDAAALIERYGEDNWQEVEDWLTEVIADSFYMRWDAIDGARAIIARIKAGDFPGLVAPLPKRGTDCPSSHDGQHHVDTSMESGPYNCFHCERPMR